jgi:hypothetical protein
MRNVGALLVMPWPLKGGIEIHAIECLSSPERPQKKEGFQKINGRRRAKRTLIPRGRDAVMSDPDDDDDFSDPFPSQGYPESTQIHSASGGHGFAVSVGENQPAPAPSESQPPRPKRHPKHPYGILDLAPADVRTPPRFGEPETIEAMQRLGYVAEDLTQFPALSVDAQNPAIREKVLVELDRRRMKMISNVIAERNRIANGEPMAPPESGIPPIVGRRKKKKRPQARKPRVRRKKRKLVPLDDREARELRASHRMEAKRLSELAKEMREVDARVKKLAREAEKKVKSLKQLRLKRAKEHRKAVAAHMKERASIAREALMRVDRV